MIPLIKLRNLQPFIAQADQSGVKTEEILSDYLLSSSSLEDPSTEVHAMVLYQVVETLAVATGDPKFCSRVAVDLVGNPWSPFAIAARSANSLGDFIIFFMGQFREHSSASKFEFRIDGIWAQIEQTRILSVDSPLSQNDAAMLSIWFSLLRASLGDKWEPGQCTFGVSDPTAFINEFEQVQFAKTDQQKTYIRFPAAWIGFPLPNHLKDLLTNEDWPRNPSSDDFFDRLKSSLRPHIGKERLTVNAVASLFKVNRRTLERRLAKEGLTLISVIEELRIERAKYELLRSSLKVSDVAERLGYSRACNFTRAFRRSTGVSPKEYLESV